MRVSEALMAHSSFVSSMNHRSSCVVSAPPTFVFKTLIFSLLARSALISSSGKGSDRVGRGCEV